MKTPAKAVKKVVPAKKAASAKKVAATKKVPLPAKTVAKKPTPVKKAKAAEPIKPVKKVKVPEIVKPVKKEKIVPAPVAADAAPAPAKPPKVRKGADKNYVAPPTAVQVQTSAKLVHTPISMGQVLNPAVIPAAIKKNAKLVNNWKTKSPMELTDAEVIAMPDDEYMNKTQLAFFKAKLVALRDGVLKNASDTTETLRHDTTVVPDPTDRATIEEEHALELRTRDRERKLLKKIQQSIGRIDQDDYGYCDETGEPIGVSRLIARPTASLSLEAQQRRELKQKMFGD
jgi:DnaK suppressor protein